MASTWLRSSKERGFANQQGVVGFCGPGLPQEVCWSLWASLTAGLQSLGDSLALFPFWLGGVAVLLANCLRDGAAVGAEVKMWPVFEFSSGSSMCFGGLVFACDAGVASGDGAFLKYTEARSVVDFSLCWSVMDGMHLKDVCLAC